MCELYNLLLLHAIIRSWFSICCIPCSSSRDASGSSVVHIVFLHGDPTRTWQWGESCFRHYSTTCRPTVFIIRWYCVYISARLCPRHTKGCPCKSWTGGEDRNETETNSGYIEKNRSDTISTMSQKRTKHGPLANGPLLWTCSMKGGVQFCRFGQFVCSFFSVFSLESYSFAVLVSCAVCWFSPF